MAIYTGFILDVGHGNVPSRGKRADERNGSLLPRVIGWGPSFYRTLPTRLRAGGIGVLAPDREAGRGRATLHDGVKSVARVNSEKVRRLCGAAGRAGTDWFLAGPLGDLTAR